MQVLERPQVGEVEDRAQVGEEPVVALSGEHLIPPGRLCTACWASAG